ncbi:hypothetical protein [Paenibacillus humicus]|uniref:hypothetical protein n=1 Tax=Paenibacillus humicus TaxID=412861 RepID=UPI000FDC9FBC|nr:hypothetical protein [Paenibacillus humicus]
MTEAWIRENFETRDEQGGTVVILEAATEERGERGTTLAFMLAVFGGVEPVTYDGLSATPFAAAGWQADFDQWKEDGKIS